MKEDVKESRSSYGLDFSEGWKEKLTREVSFPAYELALVFLGLITSGHHYPYVTAGMSVFFVGLGVLLSEN